MLFRLMFSTFLVMVVPASLLAEAPATRPTTAPAAMDSPTALGLVLLNMIKYPSSDPSTSVEVLLAKGADLKVRDARGAGPLDKAKALKESPMKARLVALLEAKQGDRQPATRPAEALDAKAVKIALNDAVWNVIQYPPDNAAALIETLLETGADPREEFGIGGVLLHGLAFNAGNTWRVSDNDARRAAAALLKAGADINGRSRGGGTPLHDVVVTALLNARYKNSSLAELQMARFLLENGADASIRDTRGKTPADVAAEIADEKVRQAMLDLLKTPAKGAADGK